MLGQFFGITTVGQKLLVVMLLILVRGGTSITIDVFDNIYVTGYFYGSVDFDFTSGVDNYTSNNELGNFVTKIDSDGSYVWTKTFNGYGQGITSDSLGNIYIIEGSGDSNTPYVYKINSDGSLAWARTSDE